jgi:tRNA threonylcarbamoyladenosine biosynthesis protein TsaE
MDPNEDNVCVAIVSKNPEQTFTIGISLGEMAQEGTFIALKGELGAGKTTLVQGIARGMGVPENYAVASPTFTIINEYPGKTVRLYHIDVYRLLGSADILETGFGDYEDGVTVVEWAEKIADIIPRNALFITLEYMNEGERKIYISSGDTHIIKRMKVLGFHVISKRGSKNQWH